MTKSVSLAASAAPIRGITHMVFAMFLLTAGDALTKHVGSHLPIGQVIFFRALFIYIPIAVLVYGSGDLKILKVTDRKGLAIRAICYACATTGIAISMVLLPLADAVALLFAGPLFVTALATPMLGEHVGLRRWAAVIVGFVGVVIMLRPTPDAIQILAIIPIVAALFSALRDVTTRRISTTESSTAMMFWSNALLLVVAAFTFPFGWLPMTLNDLWQLAVMGVIVGIAHWVMIEAYRLSEAALVSPFKYSGIVWGALFGYIFWQTVPDAFILTGGTLVVASGLYILHRETRTRSATPPVRSV